MVQALHRELDMRAHYLDNAPVETIYLGGGTPSMLPPEDVLSLLDKIRHHFTVTDNAEVTLEANPDDITTASLKQWMHAGINRLSIGIQSFHGHELTLMNRSHTAAQARQAIALSLEAGFSNLTVDLIYGVPESTTESFSGNLDILMQYPVNHISMYGLTVEPKTALAHFVKKGTLVLPPEKIALEQYALLTGKMEQAGFRQYEISNFARPGHEAVHNSNYWQGLPYLGIGPSAHSFNGNTRQWNVANNSRYVREIMAGTLPAQVETLTPMMRFNELVLTGLRTVWGVSLERVANEIGSVAANHLLTAAAPHVRSGHMAWTDGVLTLTSSGRLLADGLAADLFLTEE